MQLNGKVLPLDFLAAAKYPDAPKFLSTPKINQKNSASRNHHRITEII